MVAAVESVAVRTSPNAIEVGATSMSIGGAIPMPLSVRVLVVALANEIVTLHDCGPATEGWNAAVNE